MDISMFTIAFMVFVLACIVGYHVIWGVTPALHTPLMAVTNAISGIVVVAAIMVAGGEPSPEYVCKTAECPGLDASASVMWGQIAGGVAVALASINIFGGFVVTRRMLAMFKKKEPKKVEGK